MIKKYFEFYLPAVFVIGSLLVIMYLILSVLFVPMAPEPWNIRQDAYSKYHIDQNSLDLNYFPYSQGSDVWFYSTNITTITNITEFWTNALNFDPTGEISYSIQTASNEVLNSSELDFVLPIFFPQRINTTLLQIVSSSSSSISQFRIVDINRFVGETTLGYILHKSDFNFNVTLVFDDRYNGIASCQIFDTTSLASLNLYLNRTNNEDTPNGLIRTFSNLFVVFIFATGITIIILLIGVKFFKKK